LLERMRDQARSYGVRIRRGSVQSVARRGKAFVARIANRTVPASRVLLATGIADGEPPLRGVRSAVARTVIRYCPVCDGFEAMDKAVAVYGPFSQAASKALFMRSYTSRVTLLSTGGSRASKEMDELKRSRVRVVTAAGAEFSASRHGIGVTLKDGEALEFDALYPALGCAVHSDLGRALGAKCTRLGFLKVNSRQETSVKGLYAAGDVWSLICINFASGRPMPPLRQRRFTTACPGISARTAAGIGTCAMHALRPRPPCLAPARRRRLPALCNAVEDRSVLLR
jgi:thioredoxin reductase (NADPH)